VAVSLIEEFRLENLPAIHRRLCVPGGVLASSEEQNGMLQDKLEGMADDGAQQVVLALEIVVSRCRATMAGPLAEWRATVVPLKPYFRKVWYAAFTRSRRRNFLDAGLHV